LTEFQQIQSRELGYWQNTQYAPTGSWYYYDRAFLPYLFDCGIAMDVGSGPVPYLMNHNVRITAGYAVDPLIFDYVKLDRYVPYWKLFGGSIKPVKSVGDINSKVQTVFMLNVIDHAYDPVLLIDRATSRLVDNGRAFIYVDINKPPDSMHPHRIRADWLLDKLNDHFRTVYRHIERSWKFGNDILWYVGLKG